MNDTPGWASPGSAPSDEQEPGASGPAEQADQPGPGQSAEQPGAEPHAPGPKWSKEQPPPGQWSAPTGAAPDQGQATPPPPAPGQGGYAGPAGHGAWGGGWAGPPPAAKPGVIPLRPLGVGEVLDGAVSTLRAYWRTVLGISLTVSVITQILVILLQAFVLRDSVSRETLGNPNASFSDVAHLMGEFMVGFGVVAVISMIGTVVATALLTTVTSRAVLGKPVTIGEAWRDARPQVLRLFGLIFLLLLIGIGVVSGCLLPGILLGVAGGGNGASVALMVLGLFAAGGVTLWLMVRFSLASPALMLEKQSIRKSLSRSVKLVQGSWWRVLGIQLLTALIANILASIIAMVFMVLATVLGGVAPAGAFDGTGPFSWTVLIVSGIGSVIGSTITFPVTAGVTVLLYVDQRIRREALDLELARAAGVQGYGIGTTTGS